MNIWNKPFSRLENNKKYSPKNFTDKTWGRQNKTGLTDVHFCRGKYFKYNLYYCRLVAECEVGSTDAQYCYKLAEKLARSANEEIKYQLTVAESLLTISPKRKMTSKFTKTLRQAFTRQKQNYPLKRTKSYDSSFHNDSNVILEPFIVTRGNETIRTGRKMFPAHEIASCSILAASPEVLFLVCQFCHNFKSFVYVFQFSDSLKCKMFHSRIKTFFKIEEEDFRRKAKKKFSCPLLESYNLSALKTLKQRKNI